MILKPKDLLNDRLAQFQKANDEKGLEKLDKLFGKDEPILGFQQINETLDDAEDKYTSQIIGAVQHQTHNWLKAIAPDLNKLDDDAIERKPLNLASTIQGILTNAWREIFKTGARDGVAELNEQIFDNTVAESKGLFSDDFTSVIRFDDSRKRGNSNDFDRSFFDQSERNDNLVDFDISDRQNLKKSYLSKASFAAKDRSGVDKYIKAKAKFEVAYPPDRAELDVIEIEELKEALNLRTQVLSEDLSQEVSDRISRVIKDSVDYHYVKGKEVQRLPKASRTKILNRINGIIGYEEQKLKQQGEPADLKQIRIPGDRGFVSRAKAIASTELNAGYNLGRLQTYHRAKVKSVRWQAIGDSRTCRYCRSRQGTVVPLDEALTMGLKSARAKKRYDKYSRYEYIIPAHPFCRCAWQVATKEEAEDRNRVSEAIAPVVPLAKTWGTIGAAAGLMSKINTAGNVLSVAERITKERQLQEKAKNKARNRTLLAAGGALSLGALSIALYSWLNKKPIATETNTAVPNKMTMGTIQKGINAIASEEAGNRAIASALTKSQGDLLAARVKREVELAKAPITPAQLMRGRNPTENRWSDSPLPWATSADSSPRWNEVKQKKYREFLAANIDLKTISDLDLKTKYGLLEPDVQKIRGLQRQTQKELTQVSPYQKLLPAAVIAPSAIAKYPWLVSVDDIRTLSLNQLIKRGIPPEEANKIYSAVYNKARSGVGLAKRSKAERRVLQEINSVKSVEQLQGVLNLTRKQRDTAERLYVRLKALQAKGNIGFDNLAQIRIFGVGDKTVARMLKKADTGNLKINLLPIATDRQMAERILIERLPGVGPKTAAAIYDALMDTGTQFADADEMFDRIQPYLKLRGVAIGDKNRLKENFRKELDFNLLPGADRQPPMSIPGAGNNPPALPGGERRGNDRTPVLVGSNSNKQQELNQPKLDPKPINTGVESQTNKVLGLPVSQPVLVETNSKPSTPQAKLKAQRIRDRHKTQANINLATEEIAGLKDNLDRVRSTEIKNSKVGLLGRETIGKRLVEGEKEVSKVVQKNIDDIRRVQKQQASSLVESIDRTIEEVENSIELGIKDPLATGNYSPDGRLDRVTKDRLNESIATIDEQIDSINASRDLSKSDRDKLEKLEGRLKQLKRQAKSTGDRLAKNPTSTARIEQQRVRERSKSLLKELNDLPEDSIDPNYPIGDRLSTVKSTLGSTAGLDNPVIAKIDELIEQLKAAPSKVLNNSDRALLLVNEKLKKRLVEQKAKLVAVRDRTLTGEQKALNAATTKQRELIAKSRREFKSKLDDFDATFDSLEAEFIANDKRVTSQAALTAPDVLEANRRSAIAQAESNINTYSDRVTIASRNIDLLKSDRWQDYATSIANLEDASGTSTLSNNYVSFDELVVRRNQALRKARSTANNSVKQISAWANNPQSILLNQRENIEAIESTTEQLVKKQRSLVNKAQELIELANADLTKDYSDLIKKIEARALLYQNKIIANRDVLKNARQNLDDILKQQYQITTRNGVTRTSEQIDRLNSKLIERTNAKAARKDKAAITQVFDRLDSASIDGSEFVQATKAGKYNAVQQQLYDSLSDRQKRSLKIALDKNLLDLNQDRRVLHNSRLYLYSVSRNLKQQKRKIAKDIIRSIPVVGNRQAKVLTGIETALKSDNIEEALNAASGLTKKQFKTIAPKLERYREILGDRSKVSAVEVNILAGVKPSEIERQAFLSQVRGNLALDNANLYSLAEVEEAISLNTKAIARMENRLSAINFKINTELSKFYVKQRAKK